MDTPTSLLQNGGATANAEIRGPLAEAGDRMYPERAKPAPTLPADASPAERLYPPGAPGLNGATVYGKTQAGKIDTKVNAAEGLAVAMNPAGTTAALKTQAAELTTAAATVGLDRIDVQNLCNFAHANALEPPTEDQSRAHQLTALRELRDTHGANFDAALQAAKDLARSSPQLSAFLAKTGLGNHPAIVLRMAELGLEARARGKLK